MFAEQWKRFMDKEASKSEQKEVRMAGGRCSAAVQQGERVASPMPCQKNVLQQRHGIAPSPWPAVTYLIPARHSTGRFD